jgi:hypothetical protein
LVRKKQEEETPITDADILDPVGEERDRVVAILRAAQAGNINDRLSYLIRLVESGASVTQ